MTSTSQIEQIVAGAQRELSAAWQHPVLLRQQDVIRSWGRHTLLRCRVKQGPPQAPDFVVVKATNDPARAMGGERAGLELLAQLTSVAGLVPKLHAADEDSVLLVMQDLGDAPTLGQLLRAHGGWARQVLLESMRGLAAVHAGTRGLHQRYARLRDRSGPTPGGGPVGQPYDFQGLSDVLAEALTLVGIDSAVPDQELRQVAARMAPEPGLHALTFYDQCPSNRIMAEGRLRFVDLEFAAFRHPFLDGCYPLIGHLICTDRLHLPDGLRQQMVATYRTGIAGVYPELVEPARFAEDMAAGAAMRLVWQLQQLPQALQRDRVVGHYLIRARQRLLAALEAFTTTAGSVQQLPQFAELCRQVSHRLRARWPDTQPLSLFPIFQAAP